MSESRNTEDRVSAKTLPKNHPQQPTEPQLPGYDFIDEIRTGKNGILVPPFIPDPKGKVKELWHKIPEETPKK